MRVVWTEPALDGIARSYDYVFDFNPRAAVHLAETLRSDGDGLVIFPHRGRLMPRTGMRELVTSYTKSLRI